MLWFKLQLKNATLDPGRVICMLLQSTPFPLCPSKILTFLLKELISFVKLLGEEMVAHHKTKLK